MVSYAAAYHWPGLNNHPRQFCTIIDLPAPITWNQGRGKKELPAPIMIMIGNFLRRANNTKTCIKLKGFILQGFCWRWAKPSETLDDYMWCIVSKSANSSEPTGWWWICTCVASLTKLNEALDITECCTWKYSNPWWQIDCKWAKIPSVTDASAPRFHQCSPNYKYQQLLSFIAV